MPVKVTEERQKGSKKLLTEVFDRCRMLEMVPIFPKAFCSSVSQPASSLTFVVCVPRQKRGGKELSSGQVSHQTAVARGVPPPLFM